MRDAQVCGLGEGDRYKMMIAVTYENGEVFQHFGHSQYFKIYEAEAGAIQKAEVIDTNGQGHGALAGLLRDHAVDALICGGIGGGARNAIAGMGIELYPGVSGNADDAVRALLAGRLSYDPGTVCSHHGEARDDGEHGHHCEEHGHACGSGEHGCEGHSCGNQ